MVFNFFAMISRMRYINRWALMRNEHPENLCEHSFEVASIAHALAVIGNKRFGKSYNEDRVAALGLYHDAAETLTGDMPTPVKYHSDDVRSAYKAVEDYACESLIGMLPEDMKDIYRPLIIPEESDAELWRLVKAADKISALIKCLEEKKAGSSEFTDAAKSTRAAIEKLSVPEADVYMREFLPAYEYTLDKLKK